MLLIPALQAVSIPSTGYMPRTLVLVDNMSAIGGETSAMPCQRLQSGSAYMAYQNVI